MIHILNYFPCFFSKQWSLPLCVFFTTFTIVMTILILSTDLKVGRHYIDFNSTYIWEFEESSQDSSKLSTLIKNEYIFPPLSHPQFKNYSVKPSVHIFNLFKKKRFGIFVECDAEGHGDTEWLEKALYWRGLLTQPIPETFAKLLKLERGRSHLAQVCISPTVYPKHAFFRYNATQKDTLTAIPCFPLYALMRAYNSSRLDLLSLSGATAPLQVIKTLPVGRVTIEVITIRNPQLSLSEYADVCCKPEIVTLLDKWGYKIRTTCEPPNPACYYVCSRTECPSITTVS